MRNVLNSMKFFLSSFNFPWINTHNSKNKNLKKKYFVFHFIQHILHLSYKSDYFWGGGGVCISFVGKKPKCFLLTEWIQKLDAIFTLGERNKEFSRGFFFCWMNKRIKLEKKNILPTAVQYIQAYVYFYFH